MADLVRQEEFGDITFGAPKDITLLHSPFGFYAFLGLGKDASAEQIRAAYRRRALELHPDRHNGSDEQFKALQRVYETLSDTGGSLGVEHGKKHHYDVVSGYNDFFDGFISHKGDRTKKLSEIMLIILEVERKQASDEKKIVERAPEVKQLKEKLGRASVSEQPAIREQIVQKSAAALGVSVESIKQNEAHVEEFIKKNSDDLNKFVSSMRSSPASFYSKVLDIFYVGEGVVTFGTDMSSTRLGLVSCDDRKHVLELILGSDCYISGFPRVHFKARNAFVNLYDPNVGGIFHVVNGSVRVDYLDSSYGGVIRARSPDTKLVEGFVQKGDLFVPEQFATQNWWRKKPAVDIAVKEGSVSLRLRSQNIASAGFGIYSSTLEDLLKDSYKIKHELNESKINKKYYNF